MLAWRVFGGCEFRVLLMMREWDGWEVLGRTLLVVR